MMHPLKLTQLLFALLLQILAAKLLATQLPRLFALTKPNAAKTVKIAKTALLAKMAKNATVKIALAKPKRSNHRAL